MAVLAALVQAVRRKVHDYNDAPKYADIFYEESLGPMYALGRVNIDLSSGYSISSLPVKYEVLVVLRGAIEMCYIRGGEGASGDVDDPPFPSLQTIVVPALTVSEIGKAKDGPSYWLKLADQLEDQYKRLLEKLVETDEDAGGITVGNLTVRDRYTGGKKEYALDKPLAAPSLAASAVAGKVTLTWGVAYDTYFSSYVVQRASSLSMTGALDRSTLSDNHEATFSESPGVGTWYYRVALRNKNGLVSYSDVAQVVIQ